MTICEAPRASAGLPGKEISFILCPLTPPIPPKRDGALAGHVTGTRIIPSRKEKLKKKENDYEYLCGKLIL
jgi:hypothetical protein